MQMRNSHSRNNRSQINQAQEAHISDAKHSDFRSDLTMFFADGTALLVEMKY